MSTGLVRGGRVFISHTPELASWPASRSCVQAALDAVHATGLAGVDMRSFEAQDRPPAEASERAVRSCDVYVAVIGFGYGAVAPERDVSYTELEFDTATAMGIPRIVVLLREPGDGLPADDDRARIDEFRGRLTSDAGLVVAFVDNSDEIEHRVFRALTSLGQAAGTPAEANGVAGYAYISYAHTSDAESSYGGLPSTWRNPAFPSGTTETCGPATNGPMRSLGGSRNARHSLS